MVQDRALDRAVLVREPGTVGQDVGHLAGTGDEVDIVPTGSEPPLAGADVEEGSRQLCTTSTPGALPCRTPSATSCSASAPSRQSDSCGGKPLNTVRFTRKLVLSMAQVLGCAFMTR